MNAITLLLIGLSGFTAALTDPSDHQHTHPIRRADVPHFYMCDQYKWTGNCHNLPAPLNKCMPLTNNLGGTQIWSAGPDKGLVCKLYRYGGCPDHYLNSGAIKFPGHDNLDALGHGVAWVSYKCKADK